MIDSSSGFEHRNLTNAFKILETLGVEPLLTADDVLASQRPDPKTILLYLNEVYKTMKEKQSDDVADDDIGSQVEALLAGNADVVAQRKLDAPSRATMKAPRSRTKSKMHGSVKASLSSLGSDDVALPDDSKFAQLEAQAAKLPAVSAQADSAPAASGAKPPMGVNPFAGVNLQEAMAKRAAMKK